MDAPDRVSVMSWLEGLAQDDWRQYHSDSEVQEIARSALALLEEQKPVTMKPYYFNYMCSGCKSEIDGEFIEYTGGKIKFCPWCGKAVKWDDA